MKTLFIAALAAAGLNFATPQAEAGHYRCANTYTYAAPYRVSTCEVNRWSQCRSSLSSRLCRFCHLCLSRRFRWPRLWLRCPCSIRSCYRFRYPYCRVWCRDYIRGRGQAPLMPWRPLV